MDTQPLKALEIEALTYIYEADSSGSATAGNHWWPELRGHGRVVAVMLACAVLATLAWALR